MLLSPGIPEYLSGSSSWAVLVLNPIAFVIFVLLNAGLYTTGVILIRETVIRWGKGWPSVFTLGLAYGILEEGIALQTLFNPNAGPVGVLGYYGHWLGVSWVWTAGLLIFHATISIGLPLVLFGLALPNLKGKSLLSHAKQRLCFGILTLDCLVLFGVVNYWPGLPIMIGSFLSVFSLVYIAQRLPKSLIDPGFPQPKSPKQLFILGLLFFPAVILPGGIGSGTGVSPVIPILLIIVFGYALQFFLRRWIGSQENTRQKLALSTGLVAPVMCFGFLASLSLPVIILADVGFVFFLRRLWRLSLIRSNPLTAVPSIAFGNDQPSLPTG